ncbi:MAG: hypothetical protein ACYDB1_09750 [Acidiferrobacteraceae bacterium]
MITEIPVTTGPETTGKTQLKNQGGGFTNEEARRSGPVASVEPGICETIFIEDRDFVEKPQLIR